VCVPQTMMTTSGSAGEELWLQFQDPLLESRFLPVQQAALAQVCNNPTCWQRPFNARKRVMLLSAMIGHQCCVGRHCPFSHHVSASSCAFLSRCSVFPLCRVMHSAHNLKPSVICLTPARSNPYTRFKVNPPYAWKDAVLNCESMRLAVGAQEGGGAGGLVLRGRTRGPV